MNGSIYEGAHGEANRHNKLKEITHKTIENLCWRQREADPHDLVVGGSMQGAKVSMESGLLYAFCRAVDLDFVFSRAVEQLKVTGPSQTRARLENDPFDLRL